MAFAYLTLVITEDLALIWERLLNAFVKKVTLERTAKVSNYNRLTSFNIIGHHSQAFANIETKRASSLISDVPGKGINSGEVS